MTWLIALIVCILVVLYALVWAFCRAAARDADSYLP